MLLKVCVNVWILFCGCSRRGLLCCLFYLLYLLRVIALITGWSVYLDLLFLVGRLFIRCYCRTCYVFWFKGYKMQFGGDCNSL